jgi:polysaccharide export outer membrane protein
MKTVPNKSELVVPTRTAAPRGFVPALAMLVPLSLCLLGCRETFPFASSTPNPAPPGAEPFTSTKLQEGDVVRVAFEGDTNMNQVAKVQLNGTITLPILGEVKAAGKTPTELQADLRQLSQRLLKLNEVTVTVVSTAASVYVSGAVLRPGRIPMERPLTALEAIMEAGGFDYTRAKPSGVTVLRLENGQQRRYELNLKRALKGEETAPFYLKPFDVIYVPEKTFNF